MVNRDHDEPREGEQVAVAWGLDADVLATVVQVYGPPGRRHVLLLLTPETTGGVVAEETTLSVPLDAVQATEAA